MNVETRRFDLSALIGESVDGDVGPIVDSPTVKGDVFPSGQSVDCGGG